MLPIELYNIEQVKRFDRIAIEEFSIPGFTLMERAGQFAFSVMQKKWPQVKDVTVFCGTGNNGGDGYVLSSIAKKQGYKVKVYQVGNKNITGDALFAYNKAIENGVTIIPWDKEKIKSDLIVDAILGTGVKGALKSEYLEVIEFINTTAIPVLAIDLPSGLDANTGVPLGATVCSDVVVTFIGLKQGLFTGQARDYYKEIFFSDLSVPREIYEKVCSSAIRLDLCFLKKSIPKRRDSAHKGECGRVVVVGGAPGMSGAVRMAGEAALRVGAGLVTIATHHQHAAYLPVARPELVCFGVNNGNDLIKIITKAKVLLVGPGLGQNDWSEEIFKVVMQSDLPKVIDADGLNLLSKHPFQCHNCILTPHPGEASRLLQITTSEVENNRFQAIESLHKQYGSIIILKGAGTLVNFKNKVGICDLGNSGMATAGMGDVLAGMVVGLLAQGLKLEDAAALGVYLHAAAGDLIASEKGKYGMLATDLLSEIRRLLNII